VLRLQNGVGRRDTNDYHRTRYKPDSKGVKVNETAGAWTDMFD